jgi:hypothetical protein
MATSKESRDRPRDDEFRTEDEGGDMRGPYGGAGDYGGSYTAGGFTGAGFGGGYAGYGPDADIDAYGRTPAPGVSGGPAFSAENYAYYDSGIPVVPPAFGRRNNAGRGPRGYVRSDARIHEEVCEILTRHPEIDASDISVDVENGTVKLSGTVDDRRTKRLAEDVADLTLGVRDVDNQLRLA